MSKEIKSLDAELVDPAEGEVLDAAPSLPAKAALDSTTLITEAIDDDARYYQQALSALQSAWNVAGTVDEICKISLTTVKVLEGRRNALLLQSRHVVEKDAGGAKVMTPYNRYDDLVQ